MRLAREQLLHRRFVVERLVGLRPIIGQRFLHAGATLLFLIREFVESAEQVPRSGLSGSNPAPITAVHPRFLAQLGPLPRLSFITFGQRPFNFSYFEAASKRVYSSIYGDQCAFMAAVILGLTLSPAPVFGC